MKKKIAIKVESLSKIYKLFNKPIERLKEVMHPLGKEYSHKLYALNNVSFEVYKGETVGIIGDNGSGKSTLLKIITGVSTATSGTVMVEGRVAALLELGAGFNPEYTGIENIYLQGSIMGFSREEMSGKIDEILRFADIGDFVYQPVKMYSSGMFVRLAFAVNSCVNPDVLIVDEALSVGDVFFQNKCYRKFKEIQSNDTAILFVSHDLNAVKSFCDKVLWLKQGKPIMFGEKNEVCAAYLNQQFEVLNNEQKYVVDNLELESIESTQKHGNIKRIPKLKVENSYEHKISEQVEIVSFYISNDKNEDTYTLDVENKYLFHIIAKAYCDLPDIIVGFVIEDIKGAVILSDNSYMNTKKVISINAGEAVETTFSFNMPRIAQGEYLISLAVARGTQDSHVTLTWLHHVRKIEVIRPGVNLNFLEIKTDIDITKYNSEQIIFIK